MNNSTATTKQGRFSGKFSSVRNFAAETPAQQPEKPIFDGDKAYRLMRDAISLLNSFYPDGALEWLTINRPDVGKHLLEAENDIDQAIFAEDIDQVTAALERYVKLSRAAFKVFEARPPVIEVQEKLTM